MSLSAIIRYASYDANGSLVIKFHTVMDFKDNDRDTLLDLCKGWYRLCGCKGVVTILPESSATGVVPNRDGRKALSL